MRYLILALLITSCSTAPQSYLADSLQSSYPQPLNIQYDKFKDVTHINSEYHFLKGPFGDYFLAVAALKTCEGQQCTNPVYSITFQSSTPGWDFTYNKECIFFIDGQRHNLSEGEYSGFVVSGSQISESLLYEIQETTFSDIINSEKTEVSISGQYAVITDSTKQVWGRLYGS